jgi:hypothetical protein
VGHSKAYLARAVSYSRKMFMKLTPGRTMGSQLLGQTHSVMPCLSIEHSWAQCYKTFYVRNLRMFAKS